MAPAGPPLPDLLARAARVLPAAVAAYGPRAALAPARREALLAEVAERLGAPGAAWLHRTWGAFVGTTLDDQLDAAVAVGAVHLASPMPDVQRVRAVLGEHALGVVDLAVAIGLCATYVERAAERLADVPSALPGALAEPSFIGRVLVDVATVAAAAPFVVPNLLVGVAMQAVNDSVPDVLDVTLTDEEPNLLAHLVASVIPAHASHALLRGILARWPADLALGVHSGALDATLRLVRGRVEVSNGLAEHVLAVVDVDGALLASAASGVLNREVRSFRG